MTGDRARDPRLTGLRYAVFLTALPFGILLFALPLIGRSLGASALEIGGLFAVFSLVLVVMRPLVGRGLDRFGRRPFLLGGLLAYALTYGLYTVVSSVAGLYVARLAQGIGSGLMWLSAYAIVSDLAPAGRRGAGYGQVDEMANRGGIVGTAAAFAFLGFLGRGHIDMSGQRWWSGLFLGFTAATLAGVVLAWNRVGETLPTGVRASAGEAAAHAGRPGPAAAWRVPAQLRSFLAIVILTASASALLAPILIIYLRDHVTPDVPALGWAYVPAALAGAFLPSRFGHLSDRYGRRPLIALGLVVGAGVSLAMPATRSLALLSCLWLVEAAAFAAATPAEEALVADIAGGEQRGIAFGYYTAAASLGAVLGPLVGGLIYDTFAPVWAFRANALLLALGAALLLALIREPASAAAPAEDG